MKCKPLTIINSFAAVVSIILIFLVVNKKLSKSAPDTSQYMTVAEMEAELSVICIPMSVREIQIQINRIGFEVVTEDGRMGKQTRLALSRTIGTIYGIRYCGNGEKE